MPQLDRQWALDNAHLVNDYDASTPNGRFILDGVPHGETLRRMHLLQWQDLGGGRWVVVDLQARTDWWFATEAPPELQHGYYVGFQMPRRGVPMELAKGLRFDSFVAAQHAVFRLRWEQFTGVSFDDHSRPYEPPVVEAYSVDRPLIGYTPTLSTTAGDHVSFCVTALEGLPVNAKLLRLKCWDPNPQRLVEEEVPMSVVHTHNTRSAAPAQDTATTTMQATFPGRYQPSYSGSYARFDGPAGRFCGGANGSITLAATI